VLPRRPPSLAPPRRAPQAAEADALLASTAAAAGGEEASQYALLMRVQLALDASNQQGALQLLASPQYAGLAYTPAVLATRVALCEANNDQAGAEALLAAAVQHWQQQKVRPAPLPAGPAGLAASSLCRGAPKAAPHTPRRLLVAAAELACCRRAQGAQGAAQAVDWCVGQLVGLRLKLGKAAEAAQSYRALGGKGGQSTTSLAVSCPLRGAAPRPCPRPAQRAARRRAVGAGRNRRACCPGRPASRQPRGAASTRAAAAAAMRAAGAGAADPRHRGGGRHRDERGAAARAAAGAADERPGRGRAGGQQPRGGRRRAAARAAGAQARGDGGRGRGTRKGGRSRGGWAGAARPWGSSAARGAGRRRVPCAAPLR
jgi:hypothetical protein